MDNLDYFLQITLPLEGGVSNNPNDRGGLTNKGVTWSTLRGVKYDTNKDSKITTEDLFALTYDDVRNIAKKTNMYRNAYDDLDPELALFLTDWAWSSGFTWPYDYYKMLSQYFTNHEALTILQFLKSLHFREIIIKRSANSVFKPGWFKKAIQAGIRSQLGLNVDAEVIRKNFKYDKSSSKIFKY